MKVLTIKDKEVLLDDEDYERVIQHSWYIHSAGYVIHRCRKWTAYLHRFVLNYDGPILVDHLSGDKLDNQKCNLRLTTQKQNQHNRYNRQSNNTTGFTGVCNTQWGYQAYINIEGKRKHIGYFLSPEFAHEARMNYIRENNVHTMNA